MRIKETFIVWSEDYPTHVKLHEAHGSMGTVKYFIEYEGKLRQIGHDIARELLKNY